jgi:cytochrome P450
VEEFFRFAGAGPLGAVPRWAKAEIEVDGTRIQPGYLVPVSELRMREEIFTGGLRELPLTW